MNNYSELLPPLLIGNELKINLQLLPEYKTDYGYLSAPQRIIKLMDIYKVFVPLSMTEEIYHKLYMMTMLSFSQKGNTVAIKRANDIHNWKGNGNFHGVITGATSASIIGNSGIGKSSSIQRSINLIGDIIETDSLRLIPVLTVVCPFDCNYRGLLLQILISIDEKIGSKYYDNAVKQRMNAQQILCMTCQACQLYVGVLVIDEIQFLVGHQQLYQMILQLINVSNISVLLVGTDECISFFEETPQMARRGSGLRLKALENNEEFKSLVRIMFQYQYTQNQTPLTDSILYWLYEHTAGNISALVSLLHDAQEIAILNGTETLNIQTLTEAYTKRMESMHVFVEQKKKKLSKTSSKPKEKNLQTIKKQAVTLEGTIKEISYFIKDNNLNAAKHYKKYFNVEEI